MNKKLIVLVTVLLSNGWMWAQINEEVVDVEKSYNPSVQQVEKLDEMPQEEMNTVEKNKIKVVYTPINIPVESDYKVSPINPVKLPEKDKELVYNSFIKAGVGLPSSTLLDAFLDYEYTENQHVGLFLHHFQTTSDIEGALVDDDWSQNGGEVFYKANFDKMAAKITGGYDLSTYNYYGLGDLNSVFNNMSVQNIYNTLDPANHYHTMYANAGIDAYNDNYFDKADVLVRYFRGNYDADEFYTSFDVDLMKGGLTLGDFNVLTTVNTFFEFFDTDFHYFDLPNSSDARFFKTAVEPVLKFSTDEHYFKVGLNLTYNLDDVYKQSETYVYPIAEVMIKPMEEVNVFAGVKGGLKNHTYYDLVQNNPWMSPELQLLPTNTRYNIYGGISGMLYEVFQYKTEVSYEDVENFMMLVNNPIMTSSTAVPSYMLENSFSSVYGDAKNLGLKAELNYVGVENFEATLSGRYYLYDVSGQAEAWNYPTMTATLAGAYSMLEDQLSVGTEIYYIGDRKDRAYDYTNGTIGSQTVNSYLDANIHAQYRFADRWAAFVKCDNLFGDYHIYKNYLTTGIELMGGLSYKFGIK